MKNQKGFSLAVSFGLLIVIFLMCMASLSVLLTSTAISRSVYSKDMTSNVAESGINKATWPILEAANANFVTFLTGLTKDTKPEDYPIVAQGQILYTFAGEIDYIAQLHDNDDLDNDWSVDTDNRVIINSRGSKVGAGQTTLGVLVEYVGKEEQYDQLNRSATSESNYGQSQLPDFQYRGSSQ